MAFDQWEFDYLNLMVTLLENLIGKSPQQFLQGTTTTLEGTVSYIDIAFSMVAKTFAEECSYESEYRKALSVYMSILQNCRGLVVTYVPMMNNIMLDKLGQQVNADVPLTRIAISRCWDRRSSIIRRWNWLNWRRGVSHSRFLARRPRTARRWRDGSLES